MGWGLERNPIGIPEGGTRSYLLLRIRRIVGDLVLNLEPAPAMVVMLRGQEHSSVGR